MVRTQANDNLVTNSDACAAALACDVKPSIAVYEDDHPVASALVAAHLGGFETASGIRVPSLPPVARASTSLACCKGDGHKGYFATELFRQYGLSNATDDVGGMMDTYKRSGITALVVAVNQALAAKAVIHWSTTSHTSVDIDLYDAAGGGGGKGNRVLGRVVRCWLN
ncbi:hypothetical protein MY1884_006810 [Beauveria asiatica]